MRRKYLGLAIAAITALGPASAFGGDREIAEKIMTRLKSNRSSGALKDFTLDMKVDQGVVLFRGSVTEADQKRLVLAAAEGVEGIAKVVDEVTVKTVAKPASDMVAKAAPVEQSKSLRNMLSEDISLKPARKKAALEIAPGVVMPTAAVELAAQAGTTASDQQVVAGVVQALGSAQKAGQLKGFGVDVKCNGGVVTLNGRAGSPAQRDQIVRIAQSIPGVQGVDQSIMVVGQATQGGVPARMASARMSPVNMQQVPQMAAPAPGYGGGHGGMPVSHVGAPMMGAPVQGSPMPMGGYGGGMGAPQYESPNLPPYAWPGYAPSPNYAALTYPQQYSPSAWPYIGPFYPYPQVPLGWRKVSLEWDDGWWFLDFTDR